MMKQIMNIKFVIYAISRIRNKFKWLVSQDLNGINKNKIMKELPIELKIRERIKQELLDSSEFIVDGMEYHMTIDANKWHEIFKTDECNKLRKNENG